MPVIRIEGFKDDKGGFWVSNFLAVITGAPVTGQLQPIILNTPDTKEQGHQKKTLLLITLVELCNICKSNM